MASDDLCLLDLVEIGRRVQARQLSSVEVTQAVLDRIARLDGRLKSYVTLTADLALAEAGRADAQIAGGAIRGPLHGVPIAVKDLCHTKGISTSAGMTIHKDYRPEQDATVVTRLREAGAVLLGKLKLTEGAYAAHHPSIDPPINPWSAAHWTGVSSSGSGVATAAGLCYGSLGTDTLGSIRFPSTMNGITGLKPTWGRVSRAGVFPLAQSLDHVGPMTRSAADAAAMLGAITGRRSSPSRTDCNKKSTKCSPNDHDQGDEQCHERQRNKSELEMDDRIPARSTHRDAGVDRPVKA
jgi:amidase